MAGLAFVLALLTVVSASATAKTSPVSQGAATPQAAVRLTGGEKCFPETGRCMHGVFLGYWQARGGLQQFGYPITDELNEGGRVVQYTERARFEFHPENRDTPSEVLLSRLGAHLVAGR